MLASMGDGQADDEAPLDRRSKETTLMGHLFYSYVRYQNVCTRCGHASCSFDTHVSMAGTWPAACDCGWHMACYCLPWLPVACLACYCLPRLPVTCLACCYCQPSFGKSVICPPLPLPAQVCLEITVTPAVHSVEGSLDAFFSAEWLDGDNKYKCEQCKQLVRACRHSRLEVAPNVLVLLLKV